MLFVNPNSSKVCSVCGKEKPLSEEFYKWSRDQYLAESYMNECKECFTKRTNK